MDSKFIKRRKFIESSVKGMAGVFALPCFPNRKEDKQKERRLIFRTLGKTGVKVPVIGMGILSSGSPSLMQAALDAGITHFDSTAAQPQQARNEEMIGEVLKGLPRDSFIYGTKIHLPQDYTTGLYTKAATEKEFLKKLDTALKRLQMDYVDIVYHHMVSRRESAFYEPAMNAMEKAKKAGKARFLGITSHSNVPEAVHAAADANFYEVVMASYFYKQKDRSQVKDALAKASSAGLGVVAIKAIGGGLARDKKPVNPRAQLKWVLQDPHVHATIPGFGNFMELEMDLSVMDDLSLTEAEKNDLKREASVPEMFCPGCNQCLPQCQAGLPIPDLMRAYMYAFGYRQPALAQGLVTSLSLPRSLCEDCSSCRVTCANDWNIKGKVLDIVRLRDVPAEFLV